MSPHTSRTYVDVSKNMHARFHTSLNLLEQVKAARSAEFAMGFAILREIAAAQWRTMRNENICTVGNLLPLFQNLVTAMQIEGPVEEEGRPW